MAETIVLLGLDTAVTVGVIDNAAVTVGVFELDASDVGVCEADEPADTLSIIPCTRHKLTWRCWTN